MNKELQTNHTRTKLIEAAATIFTQKGFADASIRDIAHEAGVKSGLVYYYFKTKDELLLAMQYSMQQKYQEKYRVLPDQHVSLNEDLHEIKSRVMQNPDWYKWRYELYALSLRREDMKSEVAVLLELGRQSLIDRLTLHTSHQKAAALAGILLSCFDGLAHQKLVDNTFDLDEAYATLESVLDAYIHQN